jgi:hypothetical protein
MLYIISVAHRAQAKPLDACETEAQKSFEQILRDTIERIQPTLVAEEDCEESLKDRREISIAKRVADEKGIEHRFCDPNKRERRDIGYKDQGTCQREVFMGDNRGLSSEEVRVRGNAIFVGRQFPVREGFWLERLGDCRDRVAIFICGEGHVKNDGFRTLLASRGIPYKVIQHGIGLAEEDAWLDEALEYLGRHPDLVNK